MRPDEGRTAEPDPGLEAVQWVYEKMHIDTEWSVWEERGFTWWGRHQAQRVWSEPVVDDDGIRICRVHAQTDLVEEFDPSPENLAKINALNGNGVLSALVVDEDAGTVGYAASMWIHEQALDWAKHLWQTVVAIQAAHGNAQGEILAKAVGARAAATSHPTSGPREVGDEMLLVPEKLVVPMGREPSRWAGEEMQASLQMLQSRPATLLANGDEERLMAHFPYQEVTTLLFVSAGDRHPSLGNGVSIRLSLPEAVSDAEGPAWAAKMNRSELGSFTRSHFLGSWVVAADRPHFVAFYPNFAAVAPGVLANIVSSASNRARWAAEVVRGDDWSRPGRIEEARERAIELHGQSGSTGNPD